MNRKIEMKSLYKFYYLFFPLFLLLFISCRNDEEVSLQEDQRGTLDQIKVIIAIRGEDGDIEDTDDLPDDEETDEEVITTSDFDPKELMPYSLGFDENSYIFLSQQTRTATAFQSDDLIYKYYYNPIGDEIDWENGYNFSPDKNEPLEWFKIGNAGVNSSGFSLYALYFPNETEISARTLKKTGDNGATTIKYYVNEDQSTIEGLMGSDILGAYHSTDRLFSRLTFRMFHLMTYLRIRLYLPVYRDDLETGFREGALDHATLTNVTKYFGIDWEATPSSDTKAPAVFKPDENETEFQTIKMYQHPLPDGEIEHKKIKLEFKNYLPDKYYDQGLGEGVTEDEVRYYDFSVLIPQQPTKSLNSEFLNFYIKSNSGAVYRYYFKQSLFANSIYSDLTINPGTFQYMQLYVPRVGNSVISLNATVLPWANQKNEMHLIEEEN